MARGGAGQRLRTVEIRDFILDRIASGERHIGKVTAHKFSVTRQAVSKHVRSLLEDGIIEERGATRAKVYSLAQIDERSWSFNLNGLQEDVVWREHVEPWMPNVRPNVRDIAQYAITEMLNNAVDHSQGHAVSVKAQRTARIVQFLLQDNGVGIFQKLRDALDLHDEREGVLELSKGKFTTDPERHSGEGIFFTSRMCDAFSLMSGTTVLLTTGGEDWVLETGADGPRGTFVSMKIGLNTDTTTAAVFDRFASVEGGFAKTHVPVALAKYGAENLVSRSQAKRLLSRFERFQEVVLDFHDVAQIGQAFADEVFRVFVKSHPDVHIIPVRANVVVERFIRRAQLAALELPAQSPDAAPPTDAQMDLPLPPPTPVDTEKGRSRT